MPSPRKRSAPPKDAQSYRHPEADLPARPEIGAQAHFKKAKPPAAYRFDSSLAPDLQWDGQNPARETAEALIAEIADGGLRIADVAKHPASPERDREVGELKSKMPGSASPFPTSTTARCMTTSPTSSFSSTPPASGS